jgi:hypothetical protein
MKQTNGFTLLEIVAILVILASVTSLAVFYYRTLLNNVRFENAFETVGRQDRRVRQWCKTHNAPAQISVDLDRGVFSVETINGSPLPIPEVRIPNGMKLKELRIMGRNRFGRDTKILYSSRGTTSCWAYSIAYSGDREKYQLIVGATGQSIPFENEDTLLRFEKKL